MPWANRGGSPSAKGRSGGSQLDAPAPSGTATASNAGVVTPTPAHAAGPSPAIANDTVWISKPKLEWKRIEDVDYVREITVVDVRYRPDNPVRPNVRRDPPSSVNGMEPTWNDEFHKPTIAR